MLPTSVCINQIEWNQQCAATNNATFLSLQEYQVILLSLETNTLHVNWTNGLRDNHKYIHNEKLFSYVVTIYSHRTNDILFKFSTLFVSLFVWGWNWNNFMLSMFVLGNVSQYAYGNDGCCKMMLLRSKSASTRELTMLQNIHKTDCCRYAYNTFQT